MERHKKKVPVNKLLALYKKALFFNKQEISNNTNKITIHEPQYKNSKTTIYQFKKDIYQFNQTTIQRMIFSTPLYFMNNNTTIQKNDISKPTYNNSCAKL